MPLLRCSSKRVRRRRSIVACFVAAVVLAALLLPEPANQSVEGTGSTKTGNSFHSSDNNSFRMVLHGMLHGTIGTRAAIAPHTIVRAVDIPFAQLMMLPSLERRVRPDAADRDPMLSPVERAVPFLSFLAGALAALPIFALVVSMTSRRSRRDHSAPQVTTEFESLTDYACEGVVSIDETDAIVDWNRGATIIFGTSPVKMLLRQARELVPDNDRVEFDRRLEAFRHDDRSHDCAPAVRCTGLRRDGTEFPAELTLSKWTEDGRVVVRAFVCDVTERAPITRKSVAK